MRYVVPKGVFALCLLLLAVPSATAQQVRLGERASDFPPGPFSDGRTYRLGDMTGKLVVLYFFENCKVCQDAAPERNAYVKSMKGKPVKFFGIAANATPADVQQTGLDMPVYADTLGVMQKRYELTISLKNIYQFRTIGPDGTVVGIGGLKEDLELIVTTRQPKWSFEQSKEPSPAMAPAMDLLEFGQYGPGMKLLTPLRRSGAKRTAAAATAVYETLKKQGEAWKKRAEELVEGDPVRAYDLYNQVAVSFPADTLGKSVSAPLKNLQYNNKAVKAELAARKAFNQLLTTTYQQGPTQKAAAAKQFRNFAKRHKDTPSAAQAEALAAEVGG